MYKNRSVNQFSANDDKKPKFKGKYNIASNRLKNWDYSSDGAYFITICTKNREPFFGDILEKKLKETEQAKICREYWYDLPSHYPNCILDAFIIMPNHIHGIIFIQNKSNMVETIHELSLPSNHAIDRRKMLIPKIIGRFKMQTAKQINEYQETRGQPVWQKNYYDHIIRNEKELDRIREYIFNNPLKWDQDKNNPENIYI